jgi:transcriptional regulator with XRE-family HTH domain
MYLYLYLANILSILNPFSIDKVPSDVLVELAKKTRHLRKEKKLSQQELAKRANVSLGSYKRFERTGQISLESLLNIAFILGRMNDFDSIFTPEDQKPDEKLFL